MGGTVDSVGLEVVGLEVVGLAVDGSGVALAVGLEEGLRVLPTVECGVSGGITISSLSSISM